MKSRILIIDDDIKTCKELKYSLPKDFIEPYYVHTISEGLSELAKKTYTLVSLLIL